jgi:aldehyde dehydrogenase (NAD+)
VPELGESRLLINGDLRFAHGNRVFDNIDPTTEKVIGQAGDAGLADAEDAICAARRAFDEDVWATDLELRRRCLAQLKDAIAAAQDELRAILIAEAGCPLSFTRGVQLDLALTEIDEAIVTAGSYEWERLLPDNPLGDRAILRREPRGVVAAITAFNYPLYLNLRKSVHALAAGCTVILKPSPLTPWSASVLGRLVAAHTDIPRGVWNVLTTSDTAVAELLTTDPRVDMVSFVGSTAVGHKIASQAAGTLKKVVLELGGKSASVILDDADIETAAAVAAGVGLHAGQGCGRLTRFLVARSRYEEAVEVAAAAFAKIKVGDPRDEATAQGPQISRLQQERVLSLIEGAKSDGARCVFGGHGRPAGLEHGFFVEPTLFADVDPDSTIAQEEIFGPVAVFIPFVDDQQAVQIANNSRYGLSGAVTSADQDRALSVARRLRTGQVLVNGGRAPFNAPFGGWKESGIGLDSGVLGFEEHLEAKVLAVPEGS